jgi:hypothetical protein
MPFGNKAAKPMNKKELSISEHMFERAHRGLLLYGLPQKKTNAGEGGGVIKQKLDS